MGRENEDNSEINKDLIEQIIQNKIYSINIQGYEYKDTKSQSIDLALWVDKWSQDLMNKVFLILQTEVGYITNLMRFKDVSSGTCNLLLQNFFKEYLKKDNLENAIGNKIKELSKFKFLTSKGMYEDYIDLEDEFEEISLENLCNLFKSLRERRINIFRALLKEFKKDKEKYLDFMKKQDFSYV